MIIENYSEVLQIPFAHQGVKKLMLHEIKFENAVSKINENLKEMVQRARNLLFQSTWKPKDPSRYRESGTVATRSSAGAFILAKNTNNPSKFN